MRGYGWIAGSTLLAAALLLGCASGGPATTPEPSGPAATTLVQGIGAVTDLVSDTTSAYYLTGSGTQFGLSSIPMAGGSATTLATGIAGASSLAAFGGACAYSQASDLNVYLAAAGSDPEQINKGFPGEVGPWIASEGQAFFYARPSDGTVAAIGLDVPSGGGDEPTAPPDFLQALGFASDPELLAAGNEYVYFTQSSRANLARIPIDGGEVQSVNTAIAPVRDLSASGTHYIAAGGGGVIADGSTISSRTNVIAVAVAGDVLLYATPTRVYRWSSAEVEIGSGEGITHLAGYDDTAVFSDGASGGRIASVPTTPVEDAE